jgi:protein involved in sex pheromone biosynthesis
MSLTLYNSGYGYSKTLCEDVVTWFVSKYFPRHKLEIEVLHRGLKREGVWGFCDVAGETYKPRNFLIEMDTYLDKKTYVRTALHELYHCKQFITGELKLKSCKRYFRGECVEDLEYLEQPHEIQAHYYERILYYQYLKDRGLTSI